MAPPKSMERTVYCGRAYGMRYDSEWDLICITRLEQLEKPWRPCNKWRLRTDLGSEQSEYMHYDSAAAVDVGCLTFDNDFTMNMPSNSLTMTPSCCLNFFFQIWRWKVFKGGNVLCHSIFLQKYFICLLGYHGRNCRIWRSFEQP